MKLYRTLFIYIFTIGFTTLICADTVTSLRNKIELDLEREQFASTFSGLILLSDEMELSGATYTIDKENDMLSDKKLKSMVLPFRTRFAPWGEQKIYVEGVAGIARTTQTASDIYLGALPGHETSIDAELTTVGGLLGIGPEFRITDELTVAPILDFGLAYIRNEAQYGGPGAEKSAEYFDGLAFNWDGWTTTGGGSVRFDWVKNFGKEYKLETIGRYNIRWTKTFDTESSAQNFTSRLQLLTLRSDFIAPTYFSPFGRKLYWRALAGYQQFLEDSLYDVHYIIHLGGGLEYDIKNILPLGFGSRVTFKGAIIFGDNISGYTIGVGMTL